MSPLRQIALVAVVAAVAGTAWLIDLPALLGGAPPDAPGQGARRGGGRKAVTYVAPVQVANDAAVVDALGTAQAVRSVTLYPEASGNVTAVLFAAGQRVPAGTPLLRLDAEAEELAVKLARLNLEDARQQLARYEQVASSGAVSRSQVDRARTSLSAARIAQSQAELALAKRTLRAPFGGVPGIPGVEVGERVTPETPIAAFDDRSNLYIDFEVPEVFARGVGVGTAVAVSTWARRDEPVTGRVESTSSRIDPTTRTLRVRALVPNPDDRLRPGMSFSVRLSVAGSRYPAVPALAVQWDRQGAYVWRVVGGKVEPVRVKVLKRTGGLMLVDGPLAAGQQVVVEGTQRLRPGRKVEARPASERTSAQKPHGQ